MLVVSAASLDPTLAALQRKEAGGDKLPFSVRRFCAFIGNGSAIAAMQSATTALLRAYVEKFGLSTQRVSAAHLCHLCGIVLEGRMPPRSSGRTSASAFRPLPKEKGHTGALLLDPLRPCIRLSPGLDYFRARVTVGHEIGHFLIHRRGTAIDPYTARLPSSDEEEALSEYSSRLLLLPDAYRDMSVDSVNVMSECMKLARTADVTLHAAAARLGDPDSPWCGRVAGVISWRLSTTEAKPVPPARFTPAWHLCSQAFIPIGRCHAREGSLVAELGGLDSGTATGSRVEAVNIGSLTGHYRIDAIAWGSVSRGTRRVLAAFVPA